MPLQGGILSKNAMPVHKWNSLYTIIFLEFLILLDIFEKGHFDHFDI